MDIKIQKALGLSYVDDDRKRGIYHLMSILPDDASEDEIIAVYETIPDAYKEKLKLTEKEQLKTEGKKEDEVVVDEKEDDDDDEEEIENNLNAEDDFEEAFMEKAVTTVNFLLQKEKDLLLTTKTKNKSLLSKAIQALTKEAQKLITWEQKEATLEAYKTALSDLYNIENPEDYFTKKNNLIHEYTLLAKRQVDDKIPQWKNTLSHHRITVQKILSSED